MKILMLSPEWPLPANSGGLVRINQIFNGLGAYMDIDMATPQGMLRYSSGKLILEWWELPKRGRWENLFQKILAMFAIRPYHVYLYYTHRMQEKVNSLLAEEKYSLVYCHFIYTIPYVRECEIPIVLDQHNVDQDYWKAKVNTSQGLLKLAAQINLQKTIHFEKNWFNLLHTIISVSEHDRLAMQVYTGKWVRDFLVVPNGVDINKYQSVKERANYSSEKKTLHLGFMGSFDVQVNCDAALRIYHEILPRVKAQLPEFTVKLTLLGRNPPPKILKLAVNDISVVVPGTVSEVVPYLNDFDIFLAPLIGGAGTKLRLFEAMALKLAIIASSDAARGIDGLLNGENILLANSPDEYSDAIFTLAHDAEKRFRLGNSARKLVEEKFHWGHIIADLAKKLVLLVNHENTID